MDYNLSKITTDVFKKKKGMYDPYLCKSEVGGGNPGQWETMAVFSKGHWERQRLGFCCGASINIKLFCSIHPFSTYIASTFLKIVITLQVQTDSHVSQ